MARPKRRFRCLTRADRAAAAAPDLLRREFSAEAVNQKWCGDLTEIPAEEGKLYLASVEDLASRRLVGFAIDDHHDAALADGALKMAAAVRGGDVGGVVFHSDRGSEYTAGRFRAACAALGVTQSMGRVGSALDNAAAESSSPPWSSSASASTASPPSLMPGVRSPPTSTATTALAATAPVR